MVSKNDTSTDNQKKLNVVFHQQSHPTLVLQDLTPTTKIWDLKDKIYHHTGFVKDKMELKFDGKVLEDTKTIGDYQLPDNSHVNFKGFDAMSHQLI